MRFSDYPDKKWMAIADQETTSVRVYDLDAGTDSEVWSFHAPWPNKFQDIRLRMLDGREVLAAACDTTMGCIVDIETKELVWYTVQGGGNPHSIEILPCGIVALGSTNGRSLKFFDLKGEKPSNALACYEPHDFHGLLYDPNLDRLWAWGDTELHLLKVERTEGGISYTVEEVYTIEERWGHDMQPVIGSGGKKIWLTNHRHVLQFDTETRTFSTEYPGAEQIICPDTKAVGNYPDGTVVTMVPDAGFLPWTSYTVRVFTPGEDGYTRKDLAIPGRASYKVRAWRADYCL